MLQYWDQTSQTWLPVTAARPVPIGQVTQAYYAEASFTPAASSHTAGDVNGGAQEFAFADANGDPIPPGSSILIYTDSIRIDGANAEATAWTLYLFDVTPPSALADLGDFLLAAGDRASFKGSLNLGTAVDVGSTQWIQTHAVNAQFKLAEGSSSLFAYLVNASTVTPAAVAHVVRLHGKVV